MIEADVSMGSQVTVDVLDFTVNVTVGPLLLSTLNIDALVSVKGTVHYTDTANFLFTSESTASLRLRQSWGKAGANIRN